MCGQVTPNPVEILFLVTLAWKLRPRRKGSVGTTSRGGIKSGVSVGDGCVRVVFFLLSGGYHQLPVGVGGANGRGCPGGNAELGTF